MKKFWKKAIPVVLPSGKVLATFIDSNDLGKRICCPECRDGTRGSIHIYIFEKYDRGHGIAPVYFATRQMEKRICD